jgi:hypothetical protein
VYKMRNELFLTGILLNAVLLLSVPLTGCDDRMVSDVKAITSFVIGDAAGEISGQAIAVTVPYGTDITGLSPVILFDGSAVSPASGAAQDFTNPVSYRVSADDGSVRDYTVTVVIAPSDAKAIVSFVIGSAAGVIGEDAIAVTVPYGTDRTSLSPVILFDGRAVSPASGAAQDFTNPVSYRVTAADGSVRDYTVVVRHAASDAKAIVSFVIGSAAGAIGEDAIAVTVPYGTDITGLSPVILFDGSAVSPASGAAQDFTSPVSYRVTADDGSARDYTVTVVIAPSDAKAITSFAIGSIAGVINEQTISVTVPYGTDIGSLSPVILFDGSAVSPASGAAQDFANPVSYRVSAADGSVRDYTVVVRHAMSDAKAIVSFAIGSAAGAIGEDTIAVTVPYGTDRTSLSPVILFDGSAVSPASGAAQDFTSPVSYRVTADDGSVRDYVVTAQPEGQAPITITFTPLPHEIIDLAADSDNDLSRSQKDTLQVIADAADDAPVRWFINGEEQSETSSAITIHAINYPVGTHHVAALAYKDGIPYSDELIFKVVK